VDLLELSNCGISTSGDTAQFVEIGGVRYSHIGDPRSGMALTHSGHATVIRRDATEADAFATALSVLECDVAVSPQGRRTSQVPMPCAGTTVCPVCTSPLGVST